VYDYIIYILYHILADITYWFCKDIVNSWACRAFEC